MQDDLTTSLEAKLKQHFSARIAAVKIAIFQASIKDGNNQTDGIGIHMLGSYINHIETEHANILNAMQNTIKLEKLLGQYLKERFSSSSEGDMDLTVAVPVIFSDRSVSGSITQLKDLQDTLAAYVTAKGKKI